MEALLKSIERESEDVAEALEAAGADCLFLFKKSCFVNNLFDAPSLPGVLTSFLTTNHLSAS